MHSFSKPVTHLLVEVFYQVAGSPIQWAGGIEVPAAMRVVSLTGVNMRPVRSDTGVATDWDINITSRCTELAGTSC